MPTRTDKDRRTMEAIGKIYCQGNHPCREKDAQGMCPDCRRSIEHTLERAAACPREHAINCEDCAIHCQRDMARQQIRQIMAYAAPRMALRHPIMTFGYLRKKQRGNRRGA